MLSVARCRSLLPNETKDWPDAKVEALRDELYALAGVLLDGVRLGEVAEALSIKTALSLIPLDQRVDVEERAAILEFDAGLSRDDAERTAMTHYVLHRRG
jgi:hypothetical protein